MVAGSAHASALDQVWSPAQGGKVFGQSSVCADDDPVVIRFSQTFSELDVKLEAYDSEEEEEDHKVYFKKRIQKGHFLAALFYARLQGYYINHYNSNHLLDGHFSLSRSLRPLYLQYSVFRL